MGEIATQDGSTMYFEDLATVPDQMPSMNVRCSSSDWRTGQR
jgi:hypothetical protein